MARPTQGTHDWTKTDDKKTNVESSPKTPMTVIWTESEADVATLKPYERNPRTISKEAFDRLKESIQSLGFHQRVLCQPDMSVIGGHSRLKALTELGIKRVKILMPDRNLTKDEFRKLLIQDNLPFGSFDFDMLAADFDMGELVEWGMPEGWIVGKEAFAPEEKENDTSEQLGDNDFSMKVTSATSAARSHYSAS